MNKKLAIGVPALIVVVIVALAITLIMNNTKEKPTDPNLNNQGVETMEKSAVVYLRFSSSATESEVENWLKGF